MTVGRVAPSIGVPEDLGDILSGTTSFYLAVAEWIVDPRQARHAFPENLLRTYPTVPIFLFHAATEAFR